MNVMTRTTAAHETLIEALRASFKTTLASPDGVAEPVVLLWTDADGQWLELARRLRDEMAEFFTYGLYDPEQRTGPAIWLRCIVDRTLTDAPPPGSIPVLYLPKVSRQELRAGGDCPPQLQPLVELQYRGAVWHQRNGRDWTVEAFLMSDDGLSLDMARDTRTREAALRNLALLADTPLEALHGIRLTADDFDKLAVPDVHRDLLLWMHDPDTFRAGHSESEWGAFRNLISSDFGIDPEDDGHMEAAQHLLEGEGTWKSVWLRFAEAPLRYRGVSRLLREPTAGQGNLLIDAAKQPLLNEEAEERLKASLEEIDTLPHREACERVLRLEGEHGERRGWVWAELAESPYARALEHLASLAQSAKTTLGGDTVERVAAAYATDGWRCDQAALRAVASAPGPAEGAVINCVVRAIYEPWLDASARHFQQLVAQSGSDLRDDAIGESPHPDTCTVFADGLRFDVGALVQAKLEAMAFQVRLTHRIVPIPTVTATAKPLATFVHDGLKGVGTPADFSPVFTDTGQSATSKKLRDEMQQRGVEVMDGDEVRMPTDADTHGWTETGRLDEMGHKLGAGLALHVDREVERIANRVVQLIEAGWSRVRVVTDHGWLLLPGGLPKIDLPKYLVESRWARCATIKEGATPDVTTYGWYWNPHARIACPPGIGVYSNKEYAHGGVSPQECIVPVLDVERGTVAVAARIEKVEWRRLRCVITVTSAGTESAVDIRRNWKKAETSVVANPKPVDDDGEIRFPVSDEHEGQAVTVVVLDQAGNVLDRASTTVGEG